jgi:hypothetical protein
MRRRDATANPRRNDLIRKINSLGGEVVGGLGSGDSADCVVVTDEWEGV